MSMFREAMQEIGSEIGRLAVQGRTEVANAMFNGTAFVPYGDGQRNAPEKDEPQPVVEKQVEVEREM